MHAIKEALVAKEKASGEFEATIFYMDMRTFGKSFQRYRDQAESNHGIRFEKTRVHSIFQDNHNGDLILQYVDRSSDIKEERFDMAVLSVGQRPAFGTTALSEIMGLSINPWGFPQTEPFSLTRTDREGIVLGGSFSGLKDINDSVIQASAAALSASRVIHSAGGSLAPEVTPITPLRDVSNEPPKIMVAICTCGDVLSTHLDTQQIVQSLDTDPAVDQVVFLEQACTMTGWNDLVETAKEHQPNRILVGACLPYLFAKKKSEIWEYDWGWIQRLLKWSTSILSLMVRGLKTNLCRRMRCRLSIMSCRRHCAWAFLDLNGWIHRPSFRYRCVRRLW
jgi:heterodisulfide reductase subunit A